MNNTHIPIGGDFSRIFDHRDYLAMVSIPDEATCVLRAHLILEEVLNVWSSKLTGTDDLYAGAFVPFKTKLVISKNLGMSQELYGILDKVNEIRNRFSHRKGYSLEASAVEAMKQKIDNAVPEAKLLPCAEFHFYVGGRDKDGRPAETTYTWSSGDSRIRFVLMFCILMLKITHWMQGEFHARGIQYQIIQRGSS